MAKPFSPLLFLYLLAFTCSSLQVALCIRHQGEEGKQLPVPFRPVPLREQEQGNECQIDKINALEPTNRVRSEAGVTEFWDPNEDQFRCAGVAFMRRFIEPNGLLLPYFRTSPELYYVIRGKGIRGMSLPGCPETYQSVSRGEESQGRFRDQHQRILRFRQGDVFALPAGVVQWLFNDGDEDLILVNLIDTTNEINQLDQSIPRGFFLAGNPQQEFQEEQGSQRGQQGVKNILEGFDIEILVEVLGLPRETVERLRSSEDDKRGQIVRAEQLRVIRPPIMREDEQWEERHRGQEEWEEHRRRGTGGRGSEGEEWEEIHRGGRGGRGSRGGERGEEWEEIHRGGSRGSRGREGHRGGRGSRGGEGEEWEEIHRGGRGEGHRGGRGSRGGEGEEWEEIHRGGRGEGHRGGRGSRGGEGEEWEEIHRGGRGRGRGSRGEEWEEIHHGGRERGSRGEEGEEWEEIHRGSRGGRQGEEGQEREEIHRGGRGRGSRGEEGREWEEIHRGSRGGRQGEEGQEREEVHRGGRGRGSRGEEGREWEEIHRGGRGRGSRGEEGREWEEIHHGGRGRQGEKGREWWEKTHHGGRGDEGREREEIHHGGRGRGSRGEEGREWEEIHRGGRGRGSRGEEGGEEGREWEEIHHSGRGRGSRGEKGREWWKKTHHGGRGDEGREWEEIHHGGRGRGSRGEEEREWEEIHRRGRGGSGRGGQRREEWEEIHRRGRGSWGGCSTTDYNLLNAVANDIQQPICTLNTRASINDPSRADIYVPQAGRLTSLTSSNLPILRELRLSAERGVLYKNAIMSPHWSLNAHNLIYATRGSARVQIVNERGQDIFHGVLRENQLVVAPQNFVLVKQAGDEGFEWVSFKTDDNAIVQTVAGSTSYIKALPIEVIMSSYQVSREEAERLKNERKETLLLAGRSRSSGERESERKAIA